MNVNNNPILWPGQALPPYVIWPQIAVLIFLLLLLKIKVDDNLMETHDWLFSFSCSQQLDRNWTETIYLPCTTALRAKLCSLQAASCAHLCKLVLHIRLPYEANLRFAGQPHERAPASHEFTAYRTASHVHPPWYVGVVCQASLQAMNMEFAG